MELPSIRVERAAFVAEGRVFLGDSTRKCEPSAGWPLTAGCDWLPLPVRNGEDEPVTLVITDRKRPNDGIEISRGRVATKSHRLGFQNAEGISLVELGVATADTAISIHANHRSRPSKLVCVIGDSFEDTAAKDWAEIVVEWVGRLLGRG